MKKLTRTLNVLGLALSLTAAGTAAHGQNAKDRQAIEEYFMSSLQGSAPRFDSKRTIKLKDTEPARNAVWDVWCKANKRHDEEKLPALTPLAQKEAALWHLPASLEPDAAMPFYWGYKSDSIPAAGRPMFLYLHGSGPKDHEWSTGIKLATRFDDAPSIYFIPQIPNEGEYYRWWQKAKQYAWNRLLRQALASGQVDPDRIYMFGISEGGYGSQRLASFYADYLAAAGPMAGGEPLKNAPAENLLNTAFSLRTGDQDFGFYRDKLTRYTAAALDSLQRCHPDGYVHNVELIPGKGHHIDYSPTTPWMSQYTRNPYPRHVIWENFEMDGQYRNGFYNISVRERSNDDESIRTRYEMTIDGNSINLNVDIVTYETIETDSHWGIALAFRKTYAPATKGSVTIYLNDRLVDMNKPVTVTVNGRQVFHGKLKMRLSDMVNSCAEFFDPARVYPASVDVTIR